MAVVRVRFLFDKANLGEPVLYSVAVAHRVVPNIQRAHVDAHGGEMELLLEGELPCIEECIADAQLRGVRVERIAN